jgi:hypothetical protein
MKPSPTNVPARSIVVHLFELWAQVGIAYRIALMSLIGGLLIWGIVKLFRLLGRKGRRYILTVGTVFFLVAAVGFSSWSFTLPEPVGTYFVLWHQIVRVCAAAFTTLFIITAMGLGVPLALNRVEGGSAVGFIAARHVRASKSGFLTIISILSIFGVAVSSFALCVVISIMGGFGADLKRKILGNHAHISVDRGSVGGACASCRPLLPQPQRLPAKPWCRVTPTPLVLLFAA